MLNQVNCRTMKVLYKENMPQRNTENYIIPYLAGWSMYVVYNSNSLYRIVVSQHGTFLCEDNLRA